jgi:hypothetical protein
VGGGSHALVWAYEKDANSSAGADAGWVDGVQFTQGTAYGVTVSLPQDGWVSSSPPGIDCRKSGGVLSGACSVAFPAGARISLGPENDGANHLQSWGGACAGTNPVCTFPVTQDAGVIAAFAPGVNVQAVGPTYHILKIEPPGDGGRVQVIRVNDQNIG